MVVPPSKAILPVCEKMEFFVKMIQIPVSCVSLASKGLSLWFRSILVWFRTLYHDLSGIICHKSNFQTFQSLSCCISCSCAHAQTHTWHTPCSDTHLTHNMLQHTKVAQRIMCLVIQTQFSAPSGPRTKYDISICIYISRQFHLSGCFIDKNNYRSTFKK